MWSVGHLLFHVNKVTEGEIPIKINNALLPYQEKLHLQYTLDIRQSSSVFLLTTVCTPQETQLLGYPGTAKFIFSELRIAGTNRYLPTLPTSVPAPLPGINLFLD